MTKWIFILATAATLTAATPDAKTEKEVMAALDAYKQGLLKKDAAALNKVLGDDLAYSHSSNTHEDKAAVLKSLSGNSTTESIDFKTMKINVYGNTATVKGDVDFRNNAAGNVTISKLNVLHVFVKGPQGWQLVARQATRYGDPIPVGKK
jgi:ketosteroid isomerase-like protein